MKKSLTIVAIVLSLVAGSCKHSTKSNNNTAEEISDTTKYFAHFPYGMKITNEWEWMDYEGTDSVLEYITAYQRENLVIIEDEEYTEYGSVRFAFRFYKDEDNLPPDITIGLPDNTLKKLSIAFIGQDNEWVVLTKQDDYEEVDIFSYCDTKSDAIMRLGVLIYENIFIIKQSKILIGNSKNSEVIDVLKLFKTCKSCVLTFGYSEDETGSVEIPLAGFTEQLDKR